MILLYYSEHLVRTISVSGKDRNIFSSKRKITIRTFQHTPQNMGYNGACVYVMSPLGRLHFLCFLYKGDINNTFSDWPHADLLGANQLNNCHIRGS